MNASITSTVPISDGQNDLIERLVNDARKKAIEVINPDSPAAQRIIMRGDELAGAIIDKIRELSLASPDMPCFGVGDWQTVYHARLTPKQMMAVEEFPCDAVLNSPCPFNPGKMVRETHFAFVGLEQITIMELQKLNPKKTEPRFYDYAPDSWYSKEKFAAKETLKLHWYLLLKDIVPGSESKTFDEQVAMLPKEYEVPSAVAETAKDLLIFKKTGVYVNPTRYARTSDVDSDGRRVSVGYCDSRGVRVSSWYGRRRLDYIGVAASRKSK